MDKSELRLSLIQGVLTSFTTTKKQIDNMLQCSVCLTFFGLDELAKMLPCGHAYHEDCIYPWLRLKTNCPDCRRELLPPDEEPEIDEDGELETTWEDEEPWTVTLSHSGRHVEILESAGGLIYVEPISPVEELPAADHSRTNDRASPLQPDGEMSWEVDWTETSIQEGVEVLESAGGTVYVEPMSPDPNFGDSFAADLSHTTNDSQHSPRPESEGSTIIDISSDESDYSCPLPPKRRYEHRQDTSSSTPRPGGSGYTRYWDEPPARYCRSSDSSISSVTDDSSDDSHEMSSEVTSHSVSGSSVSSDPGSDTSDTSGL